MTETAAAATIADEDTRPQWVQEVDARLAVNPHFVVAGNTHDLHHLPEAPRSFVGPAEALTDTLARAGFGVVLGWTVTRGTEPLLGEPADVAAVVGKGFTSTDATVAGLGTLLDAVGGWDIERPWRAAVVVTGAERLAPERTDPDLHALFVRAQELARRATRGNTGLPDRDELHNLVVWLVDQEHDLPFWYLGTPGVHVVSVPLPELAQRQPVAQAILGPMPTWRALPRDQQQRVVKRFAQQSQGMSIRDMDDVRRFAFDRGIPATEIESAVRGLRSGLRRSPWQDRRMREAITESEELLAEQVLGQKFPIRKAVEVLSRSVLGLSGVQAGGHAARPKGVLFFAGPTGVGKTELAKQLATLVFGSEDSLVRFDMSEFSSDHTVARLVGAPPGYEGHESGGELTNAVRRRPYSVLLFDEIEKADKKILKIFLQVLEDGRLTDGSGSTVYFGETLIVFTTNLGIYPWVDGRLDVEHPIVGPTTEPAEMRKKVIKAIDDHFKAHVGMPELFNRIGADNVVVFGFLTAKTAAELLDRAVDHVVERVRAETKVDVTVGPRARDHLREQVQLPENLAYGGRRVGAIVESRLVNPIARRLLRFPEERAIVVDAIVDDPAGVELEVSA